MFHLDRNRTLMNALVQATLNKWVEVEHPVYSAPQSTHIHAYRVTILAIKSMSRWLISPLWAATIFYSLFGPYIYPAPSPRTPPGTKTFAGGRLSKIDFHRGRFATVRLFRIEICRKRARTQSIIFFSPICKNPPPPPLPPLMFLYSLQ